jgi:hypothetical protein
MSCLYRGIVQRVARINCELVCGEVCGMGVGIKEQMSASYLSAPSTVILSYTTHLTVQSSLIADDERHERRRR